MTTIYLSSTYEDLKEHRSAVFGALRKSGYTVIAMEDYVATDLRPLEECLKDIYESADIYIGIFAFRYGYIPPPEHIKKCEFTTEHDDWHGLSITEVEFRYAQKIGVPCLIYLAEDGKSWPLKYVDAYTERSINRSGGKIDQLRKNLLREKHASVFTSPYQLASLVQASVSKLLKTRLTATSKKLFEEKKVTWDIEKNGSPYPGLMHFTRRFAPVFFGRELEVQEILKRMHYLKDQFILISGDSGIGKSSIVDAGVLPKIEKSDLIGEKNIICVRMIPSHGYHPFDSLMRALHAQTDQAGIDPYDLGEKLLKNPSELSTCIREILAKGTEKASLFLFLDQMEELFIDPYDRYADSFITSVCKATQNKVLWTIATIRSDHLHYCYNHPELLRVLGSNCHYPLGQIVSTELRDMIKKPAQCAGLKINDHLVQRIAKETGFKPGMLPILSFVLQQLFEKREGYTLSEEIYNSLGGVEGSIKSYVRTVENELKKKIGNDVDHLLPKLFLSLLEVDAEGLPTRRRILLNDLTEDLSLLVSHLIKARLLTIEGEGANSTISIIYERLHEVWPTLSHWVAENQDDLRVIQQAEAEAKEWEDHGHDLMYLWRVNRLRRLQEALSCLNGPSISDKVRRFAEPQKSLVSILNNPSLSHNERIDIDIYLTALGDPRPGVGLCEKKLPNIVWCKVPKGNIRLKGRTGNFLIKPFFIAKYPVTWRQYRSFIEDKDGYKNNCWWEGLAKRQDESGIQYHKFDNNPVENVSWYDSVAFCRWLTKRLGYDIRLPTEWEWEQAATGGYPQNTYPWGSEWKSYHSNTIESGVGRTTAVGLYPHGASAVGAHDMSGNIFEWCLNEFKNPQNVELSGENHRVAKGGAWNYSYEMAQCDHSVIDAPDLRDPDLGFRLCCSLCD